MEINQCPCGNLTTYHLCCEPYHLGNKHASSAEILMRSRYSAYVFPNGEYLMKTTLPAKRKFHSAEEMEDWGKQNNWISLEIIDSSQPHIVEFRATYRDINQQIQIHHERSTFQKLSDKWYYVHGVFHDEFLN